MKYAVIISILTIVVRILWIYPAAFIPRWLFKSIRDNEPNPGMKNPFIIGWAGMRGVISLASVLSIPLFLNSGQPFPHRNLILFITFTVILVTLVFQGLTLPLIVKWLEIKEIDHIAPEEEQEAGIKLRIKKAALNQLNEKYSSEIKNNELLSFLKHEIESDISLTHQRLNSMECQICQKKEIEQYNKVLKELYSTQRKELYAIRKEYAFSDDEIRKQEMQLDFDEAKVTYNGHS